MHHLQNLSLIVLLFSLPAWSHAAAPVSVDDQGKIVPMQPFNTMATFDVDYRCKKGTTDLEYAKVIWATPGFKKVGLKNGDLLVSIDGKPVNGMPLAELRELLHADVHPGLKRTYIFKGKRGIFGQKEWTTTAEIAGDPPKPPTSPTSPTPAPTASVLPAKS